VIGVAGRSASGLSALIFASSQEVISAWKMPAMTSALRLSSSTPSRLYDTVIGAATVGKYSSVPVKDSVSLGSESEPA
jgi:hypothetical protein